MPRRSVPKPEESSILPDRLPVFAAARRQIRARRGIFKMDSQTLRRSLSSIAAGVVAAYHN
ncbi:hypothetical protein BURKHO8Y_240097 [Burkholderia sp. 8Y]|nr:hypothetical protein BURKHO8Y_240097 [Burkholderia sp. 8Y]